MADHKLPGRCGLCGATYDKRSMSRHVKACRRRNVAPANAERWGKPFSKPTRAGLHVVVESADYDDYWLHLEVAAQATLRDLDAFLRKLWLECCGHLSAFEIGGAWYQAGADDDPWEETRSMDVLVAAALKPGGRFGYRYDFGSTTRLTGRVLKPFDGSVATHRVSLLARNAPFEPRCHCGELATEICTQCIWQGGGWLCPDCATDHDCGEECLLPVVDSPRVGVCGYTGLD